MSPSRIIAVASLIVLSNGGLKAACNPELLPVFPDQAPNSGHNFALVNLDLSNFPDSVTDPATDTEIEGIHERMQVALDQAMDTWNSSCEGEVANHYPKFVPMFDTSMDAGFVHVVYKDIQDPAEKCSNNNQKDCHAVMETRNLDDGSAIVTVYGESGAEDQLVPTFVEDIDNLGSLLTHELGHALGLEHDKCGGSFMNRDPREATAVHSKTCDLLKTTHRPRHPLQDLSDGSGLDPSCALGSYCLADFNPWPTIRTTCGWNIRTVTATIEIEVWNPISGLFTFITTIERRVTDYICLPFWAEPPPPEGGDLPDPPPITLESLDGPRLALALPRPDEVVDDALYLRGWASSWTHGIGDLALWIDGEPVEPADFEWGFYSPELCQARVDPGACDPYSGFSATLDVSSLAPGPHTLDVAAVDGRSVDPLPVSMRRNFVIEGPTGPVAINDHVGATIDLTAMAGLPVEIEVTANDYDPGGAPIRLTDQAVVIPPEHGSAVRVDDHHIRYTPRLDAGPSDTFKYAIRNPDDQRDRGRVNVTILYLIYWP